MATEGTARRSPKPPNPQRLATQHFAVCLLFAWTFNCISLRPACGQSSETNLVAAAKSETVTGNDAVASPTAAMPSVPKVSGVSTINEALDQRGSITFRKTQLQEVVFLLSELWNVNIVAGEKVTGEVNGVFQDAPLRDVLAAILTSSGYGYTSAGDSLVVLPIEEVGTSSPQFVSRTLPLQVMDDSARDSTIEAAKLLLSDRGRIQAFGGSSVLVVDVPDRVVAVEAMLVNMQAAQQNPGAATAAIRPPVGQSDSQVLQSAGLYRPRIAYFTPQFTEASEMAEALEKALGSGEEGESGVIVAVYKEENRIMVKGSQDDLTLAAEAFQQLDVPRAQVRITTMIYDVALKELEELGVNWGRNFRLNSTDSTPLAEFVGNVEEAIGFSTLGADGASSIGFRTLSNNFDTTMLLNALDSTSEAKLLADPSITVADRHQASIKIVQRIPIVAADASVDQSNVVFAQVEFEDAGVILNVTPRISNDNTIEMKVTPEYSVVTDYINDNPVIDSRTAETTVRVQNGHMFVLGGLRQKSINEVVSGVPVLRDIKFIGKLFQSHNTEIRESELIVFLKPELICPTYAGKPREVRAATIASRQLDAIPYATVCPQTPKCCDPKCPNHHPRVRVNGGSEELRMLGDYGLSECVPFVPTYLDTSGASPVSSSVNVPIVEGETVVGEPNVMFDDPMELTEAGQPADLPPVHVKPFPLGH